MFTKDSLTHSLANHSLAHQHAPVLDVKALTLSLRYIFTHTVNQIQSELVYKESWSYLVFSSSHKQKTFLDAITMETRGAVEGEGVQ